MDPHQSKLIEAAEQMGFGVHDLNNQWSRDAVVYSYAGQDELVLDGRIYSSLSHLAEQICDDKHVSKNLFRELEIRTPESMVFSISEDEDMAPKNEVENQISAFFEDGKTYVCKPVYGTDGHAVGMHLTEPWKIADHAAAYRDTYMSWLLEEQVKGEDLRVQVIGNKIVAACVRQPAFIEGDGVLTLDELIGQLNEQIAKNNANNRLEIDGPTRQLMREQNLFLGSVVEAGRKIVLKHVANMGQGGRALDVTDVLHPDYHQWIDKIAAAFGIRIFAFDAICDDVSAPPAENCHAIEVNAKAQWLHHTFSDGKQHDIPSMILRDLFGMD